MLISLGLLFSVVFRRVVIINMSFPATECKDEAHEDAVASLLLQEIDFLALAALGSPAPSTLDGDCLSSNDLPLQGDEDNLTNTFKQQVDPHSRLHGTYPWEDSLPLPGDTSLCDEDLPEDFDLLSYAADTPDDRFLQRNETAVNFYDSFDDTVTSTLDLRSTSPSSELSECETQFTKIKPRPKYLTDGCDITDDFPGQPPLKMQSRRDGEPKRPKNGFIRYSIKHRAQLLKLYPYKDNRSISKLLGIRWKKMTAEEKQPYVDEFNNDIHEIRVHNPKWRYAPAKRSAEELIDPMSKRLRPRDKIRSKMWSRDTEWEWGFSADDSDQSQSGSEGRHSPLQQSATTWKQCDVCNLWRPLPGHVDSDDLPKTWCCFMNPDSRFNRCWLASAPPPVYSSHCTTVPRQHTYTMAPSHCIAASRHTALSQCMPPAHQSSVLLLLPAVCSAASNIASGVLVSHTPLL